MKTILKTRLVILVPETDEEREMMAQWKEGRDGHVFGATQNTGDGLSLVDLGSREDACREPINVISASRDPRAQLISNFAHTPFDLDGEHYESVEGFWQGLRFESRAERRRIAALWGKEAKRASPDKANDDEIVYEGQTIRVGTWRHWELMERACLAKFTQHAEARAALLATGDRPLIHRVRRDSKTIPGAIMAEIWMRIRRKLRPQEGLISEEVEDDEQDV